MTFVPTGLPPLGRSFWLLTDTAGDPDDGSTVDCGFELRALFGAADGFRADFSARARLRVRSIRQVCFELPRFGSSEDFWPFNGAPAACWACVYQNAAATASRSALELRDRNFERLDTAPEKPTHQAFRRTEHPCQHEQKRCHHHHRACRRTIQPRS